MKKIIKLLNRIFAPRVTYYYNDKKVTKMPKEVKEKFEEAKKTFDKMFEEFTERL